MAHALESCEERDRSTGPVRRSPESLPLPLLLGYLSVDLHGAAIILSSFNVDVDVDVARRTPL